MGDKKRKVIDDPTEASIAPEGKKLKKDKTEKKDKSENGTPTENIPGWKLKARQERKEKKEKKRGKKEEKEKRKHLLTGAGGVHEDLLDTEAEQKRKEKKERKDRKYNSKKLEKAAEEDKKKSASQDDSVKNDESKEGESEGEVEEEVSNEVEETANAKAARFICFVGNLPYSANTESVTKHFEKNPPASVRVATKKDAPKKCRGFAFIEFDNYDRMKTALKLYHHSTFDDGKYPPRRINVELTAGGGGANSEHRKAKIQAKNEKLNDERQRDVKQTRKDKRKLDKSAKPDGPTGANAVGVEGAEGDDQFAGVHPSRRGRMQ